MRKLKTAELMPGMIVAEDIYTYNNKRILTKGIELTDNLITRLEFYSILSVKVEDEVPPAPSDSPEKPATDEPTHSQKLRASRNYIEFKVHFDRSVESLRKKLEKLADGNVELNVNNMLDSTLALINTANGSYNIFDMLHNMRQYDDSTYAHCLNVSLICHVLAKWLNMTEEQIHLATLCGLLHDVGKIKIPDEIIKKPAKLTTDEFSIIKTHPLEGYRMLQKQHVNKHVENAALMHHERCDGSGYPHGLTGSQIDTYAKMVAIADVYEAMTAPRVYRGPMCPFIVIDIFETEGLQKYEPAFIMTFLENIVNTYLGSTVKLSNGESGEVVFINKQRLARPIVKVGETFHDLLKEPDISIEALR